MAIILNESDSVSLTSQITQPAIIHNDPTVSRSSTPSDEAAFIIPEKIEDTQRPNNADLNDPKYQRVLTMLRANGYPDATFLGSSGYVMPVANLEDPVRLICPSLASGFKINILGEHYSAAESAAISGELMRLSDLVDRINALLADATEVSAMDRHLSESVEDLKKWVTVYEESQSAADMMQKKNAHELAEEFTRDAETAVEGFRVIFDSLTNSEKLDPEVKGLAEKIGCMKGVAQYA